MPGSNYYILSHLPGLGGFGSEPTVSAVELADQVAFDATAGELVRAVLLGDDLLMRQSVLAGELKAQDVSPAVLTLRQVRDEEPLPVELSVAKQEEGAERQVVDRLWSAYFNYGGAVARRGGSELLLGWLSFELALRNELAEARAKALELEGQDYVVRAALAGSDYDFGPLLTEWASAATPLAGLRVLDRARWGWLEEHGSWFSFGYDELVAYAAKLMLLHRWGRVARAEQGMAAGGVAGQSISERTTP